MAFSERQVKMKKTDPSGSIMFLFVFAESILYVSFLALDLLSASGVLSAILKYCSILLCFFFSLMSGRTRDRILITAALGLTAVADLFLLILDSHYLTGVLCFCGVQMLYYCRILRAGGIFCLAFLPVRFLLTGCIFLLLGILHIFDPLSAAGAFYFTQLLFNAAESLAVRRKNVQYTLFCTGLFLFICCDLCVGLSNLRSMAVYSVPEPVLSFAQIGMWLFYLPSQVLITLSVFPDFSSCISVSS